MALFGSLFRKKKSDPSSWDELWTVLAPYGGRVTPSSTQAWLRAAATMDPKLLATAREQLEDALVLLDTEAAARFAGGTPFTGPDRPFARRRFLRALDAVIVAGPEAVARVVADPSSLRSYDSSPAVAPYDLADPDGYLIERWEVAHWADPTERVLRRDRSVPLGKDRFTGWPSLAVGDEMRELRKFVLDPEAGWLDVDASAVGVRGGQVFTDRDGWIGAGIAAGRLVHDALGDMADRPPKLLHVFVGALPREDWEGEVGFGLEVVDGVADAVTGDVNTERYVPFSDEECAIEDQDERVGLLVRRVAHALLAIDLPFDEERAATLRDLARGA
ncbi:hypothetical protein ACWFNS_00070 [Oerskovia enterophila]